MHFALDYDGTFTEDRELWTKFVAIAKEHGHQVTFVTYRRPHMVHGIEDDAKLLDIPIVYTNFKQKKTAFKADVWIDDQPELIPTSDEVLYWER